MPFVSLRTALLSAGTPIGALMNFVTHCRSPVIAVDQNFIPLQELSRRHALRAVVTGRAQVLDLATFARSGITAFTAEVTCVLYPSAKALPEARLLQLGGYRGVLRRDRHTCAYCGHRATTVDHVRPRCQGGPTTWNNLVAACFPCNQRKGGRTPEQAGMPLRFSPRSPRALLMDRFLALAAG